MPASKGFLVTRPKHEILLSLLFHWTKPVVDAAYRKGYQVLDLSGEKATHNTFTSYMKKNTPSLVFFNGHGSATFIMGQDNEILIEADTNVEILRGTVVYARSCDAAKQLGIKAVENGCRVFIGYKRKFVVAHSTVNVSHPFDDTLAKLFIEPSNIVSLSLLKGNPAGEAYHKSQRAMRRNLSFMLSSAASTEQQAMASYLWGNIKAQVVLGDQQATV